MHHFSRSYPDRLFNFQFLLGRDKETASTSRLRSSAQGTSIIVGIVVVSRHPGSFIIKVQSFHSAAKPVIALFDAA